MIGARVNEKIVNIDHVIHNGDRVEIITSQNSRGPSRDWLNIVKSTQAKNKITQWFKQELKEDNIIKGKELLDKYCKSKSIMQSELLKPAYMEGVLAKYSFKDWESVLAAVGHGGLKEGQVVNRLLEEYKKEHAKKLTDSEVLEAVTENKGKHRQIKSGSGITVKGIEDVAVRFSKCCSPVPGDEIVGFVTRGRGVSIHRTDCINIMNLPQMDRVRLLEAEWQKSNDKSEGKYLVEINIYAYNRTGILADVSKIMTERNIDVTSMNVRTSKQGKATISMSFEIGSVTELNKLVDRIRSVESIIDIVRTSG